MSAQRIKDASFIQQHIEKLILAAGVLIFLGAAFLFVGTSPFAIEVNRKSYDDPADAIDVLVQTDNRIEAGLQATNPLPEVDTPDFIGDVIKTIQIEPDYSQLAENMGASGTTLSDLYPDPGKISRYALVYPPVPKNITHVSDTDVLDKEFDPAMTRVLFDLWGKDLDEPGDFTMFVAAGEFDLSQWAERLEADSEIDGEIKIPAGIWGQRFGIAGVALLREELVDPVQNIWDNRQIVVPLPGQVRILPSDQAEGATMQAMTQLAALREAQIELAQPDLPWLKGFVQVTAPGFASDSDAASNLFQRFDKENLGPTEKEILKLQEKIEQLEERRAQRQQGGGDRPVTPPGAFDPRNPGGTGPATNTDQRRDPITRQIDNLRERIARLQPRATQEAENRRRLEEQERLREEERRRREAERDRGRLAGPGGFFPGQEAGDALNLEDGATIRVWAADPSMQPGKTYRYKLLVSVINPLYGVPRLAPDQLAENQQRAALFPTDREIEAMPWISPIVVEPESRFFFTRGRDTGARVEIFRRVDGWLRSQQFDATPGDAIGGMEEVEDDFGQVQEVDMSLDAILVDIQRRRDAFSGNTTYTLVYSDAEGNLLERTDAIDSANPILRILRKEVEDGPDDLLRPAQDAAPAGGGFPAGGGPFTPENNPFNNPR